MYCFPLHTCRNRTLRLKVSINKCEKKTQMFCLCSMTDKTANKCRILHFSGLWLRNPLLVQHQKAELNICTALMHLSGKILPYSFSKPGLHSLLLTWRGSAVMSWLLNQKRNGSRLGLLLIRPQCSLSRLVCASMRNCSHSSWIEFHLGEKRTFASRYLCRQKLHRLSRSHCGVGHVSSTRRHARLVVELGMARCLS